jgi:hypothetical protein
MIMQMDERIEVYVENPAKYLDDCGADGKCNQHGSCETHSDNRRTCKCNAGWKGKGCRLADDEYLKE